MCRLGFAGKEEQQAVVAAMDMAAIILACVRVCVRRGLP